MAEWKVGDYGVTVKPLTVASRFVPVGTFVVVKVSEPSSFTTEAEGMESYMTSHRVVYEGLDKDRNRFQFSYWAELDGDSPIRPVTHEMTVIALAASGL